MIETIIGAVIGGLFAIAAAFIPLIRNRKEKKKGVEAKGKFAVNLYVALGDKYLGPINMVLYFHHLPEIMTNPSMDKILELPSLMQTKNKRKIFWLEGNKYLDEKTTYGKQKVQNDDTLILTDILNKEIIPLIFDSVLIKK